MGLQTPFLRIGFRFPNSPLLFFLIRVLATHYLARHPKPRYPPSNSNTAPYFVKFLAIFVIQDAEI
jgi:hypothetical protein